LASIVTCLLHAFCNEWMSLLQVKAQNAGRITLPMLSDLPSEEIQPSLESLRYYLRLYIDVFLPLHLLFLVSLGSSNLRGALLRKFLTGPAGSLGSR